MKNLFIFILAVMVVVMSVRMYAQDGDYRGLKNNEKVMQILHDNLAGDHVLCLSDLNKTKTGLNDCNSERQYYTNKFIDCETRTTTSLVEATTTVITLSHGSGTPLPVFRVADEDAETKQLVCWGNVSRQVRGGSITFLGEVPCIY